MSAVAIANAIPLSGPWPMLEKCSVVVNRMGKTIWWCLCRQIVAGSCRECRTYEEHERFNVDARRQGCWARDSTRRVARWMAKA